MIPFLPAFGTHPFPSPEQALQDPDGLLCAGGDLSVERLKSAYRQGIFPWFSEGEPILWWSPSERTVIVCDEIHISRSMGRVMRQQQFEFRHNTAFEAVVRACAAPRHPDDGTWILPEMIEAYCRLHEAGYAHSYECWQDGVLVGGTYGVRVGNVFCGESMFSHKSNASKAALIHISQRPEYNLIDCQMPSAHLATLGAQSISRNAFLQRLKRT